MKLLGKGSNILAIIAIVIGLGVGSYLVYDNFIAIPQLTDELPPENQWYDYISGTNFVPASQAWGTLSSVTLNFNTSSGQSIHFLFVGQVNFDDSSTPSSYVEIVFRIDAGIVYNPRIYVRRYNLDSSESYRMSVSLQHYRYTITPGNHTIEVLYRGNESKVQR